MIPKVFFGKWDAFILLGDMFILSSWIAALLAKLRKRKVYFWGHGLYGNEKKGKLFLRKLYLSIADGHFLYGHYAKDVMQRNGFNPASLHVIYNSLDYDFHKSARAKMVDNSFYPSQNYFTDNSIPVLIFIGRLTPEKKLVWLLNAMNVLISKGTLVNLLVIGDGTERKKLEKISIKGHVHYYGACYDEFEIGRLIANADLCVSPGNVGLTAIHSLSYGTPVCTHNDMTAQMPEAEAIIDGETGVYFENKEEHLETAIEKWVKAKRDRDKIRQNCYAVIDSRYNPQVQLAIFKDVLLKG